MIEAAKNVHDAFALNLKGWTRENVEPFGNEANIIVENWGFHDRRVRVSIALMRSGVNNEQWLADFLRRDMRAKRLEGIGDAAAVWGYAESVVTFHTSTFNVSVSSATDFKLLGSYGNAKELNESESAATTRLIACFVNIALKGDLRLRKHVPGDGFLSRPCEQELLRKGLLSSDLLSWT